MLIKFQKYIIIEKLQQNFLKKFCRSNFAINDVNIFYSAQKINNIPNYVNVKYKLRVIVSCLLQVRRLHIVRRLVTFLHFWILLSLFRPLEKNPSYSQG